MTKYQDGAVMRDLTYEPLPFATHPIDIAHGSQGWGPMDGPYTPFNFPSPVTALFGDGIDITWGSGNNDAVRYQAPGYAVSTIFPDPSQYLVNNSHLSTSILKSTPGSATIQQGPPASGAGTAAPQGKTLLLKNALRSILGMR